MDSVDFDLPKKPSLSPQAISAKIVVAGGFGVGKTTFVGSVSEILPLTTEAAITEVSAPFDDLRPTPDKGTTTVAMDFGRVTLSTDLVLYLFGTPGQRRFWFMWDDLVRGAIGAVILVDTRRLADCFGAVDYFEDQKLPYIVGVNRFDGVPPHRLGDIREAMAISEDVPIVECDARQRDSTKQMLISMVKYAMRRTEECAVCAPLGG